MRIRLDSTSPLLTPTERLAVEQIATRLRDAYGRPPLPAGYRESLDQTFGTCCEGDDRDRSRR
jgi:hypothetical protein